MKISRICRRAKKILNQIRFKPIDVLVFHAVSDRFDGDKNVIEDWISTEDFKKEIKRYQKNHTFISITEAEQHLKKDWIRHKKYAVLTSDDGYKSVLSILPFLEEQRIPITLFINPKYLDSVSVRENYCANPEYITDKELSNLTSPYITIGMHGYEHIDATKQTRTEFEESLHKCMDQLGSHPRYIPYFAYTWGRSNNSSQEVLLKQNITPVFSNGETNYKYTFGIFRFPVEVHQDCN